MKIRFLIALLAGFVMMLVLGQSAWSQTDDAVNYRIDALRADLRADKAEIVNQAMDLKPEEAKVFWPVYKQYDQEVSRVNDDLVQLIKTYAEKFGILNEIEARELTQKAFDYQSRRIELKKKYFPIFSKATTAMTAAKFFQVEYRLELLLNLKIASELPPLLSQPVALTSDAPAQKKE